MELIILGEKYDSNKEFEFSTYGENGKMKESLEHGVDVHLTRKDGSVIKYYNATEYHHLWDRSSVIDTTIKDRLAVESDIHSTGYVPWDIFKTFSKIEVVKSSEVKENFC